MKRWMVLALAMALAIVGSARADDGSVPGSGVYSDRILMCAHKVCSSKLPVTATRAAMSDCISKKLTKGVECRDDAPPPVPPTQVVTEECDWQCQAQRIRATQQPRCCKRGPVFAWGYSDDFIGPATWAVLTPHGGD